MRKWLCFLFLTSFVCSAKASDNGDDPWGRDLLINSGLFQLSDSFDPATYNFGLDMNDFNVEQNLVTPQLTQVNTNVAKKNPKGRSALSKKTIEFMISHHQQNLPNVYKLLKCIDDEPECNYRKLKKNVTSYRKQIYSLAKTCLSYGFIVSPRIGYWELTVMGVDALEKLTAAGYENIASDENQTLLKRARSDEELIGENDENPAQLKRYLAESEEPIDSSDEDGAGHMNRVRNWNDLPEQVQAFLLNLLEANVMPNLLANQKLMSKIIEGDMLNNLKNLVGMQFVYMTGVSIDDQLDELLKKHIRIKFEK